MRFVFEEPDFQKTYCNSCGGVIWVIEGDKENNGKGRCYCVGKLWELVWKRVKT